MTFPVNRFHRVVSPLKTALAVLLGVLIVLGPVVGAGIALANGEEHQEEEAGKYELTFFSNPRFPVVGEEAELTFRVSDDGSPVDGLMVMGMVAKAEEDQGHGHGEVEAQAGEAEAEHSMTAKEVSPGVYMFKHTFEAGGEYAITAHIGEEAHEFAVAVRSSPVSWPFVMGLTAFSLLLAGAVAMIKTIRKEW